MPAFLPSTQFYPRAYDFMFHAIYVIIYIYQIFVNLLIDLLLIWSIIEQMDKYHFFYKFIITGYN